MHRRHRKPPGIRLADSIGDPPKPRRKRLDLDLDGPSEADGPDSYAGLERASKKTSLFGRVSAAFQDALQSSRGDDGPLSVQEGPGATPEATADDLAIRRAKKVSPRRMIVPEGVIISGSMTSGSETEISGRVEGDVNVDGRLHLGATALVTGNVRAVSCKVEGLVEGTMECSNEIDLGRSGRLNADAMAGKRITVAGQAFGSVATGGMLRLVASGRIEGDIHARRLVIEEGATFNGGCTMRRPAERKQG